MGETSEWHDILVEKGIREAIDKMDIPAPVGITYDISQRYSNDEKQDESDSERDSDDDKESDGESDEYGLGDDSVMEMYKQARECFLFSR